MSPASATQRRERAIIAALHVSDRPLTVAELCKRAAQLGPDAPQIPPTVRRMLTSGALQVAPGQQHGVRFRHLYVMLPHGND